MIALTDNVVRRQEALSTVVDGCVVLLDSAHQNFVGFDDIGTYIWRAIESPISVADLCADLSERYAAQRSVIESDVMQFLNRLLQQDLIEVTSPA